VRERIEIALHPHEWPIPGRPDAETMEHLWGLDERALTALGLMDEIADALRFWDHIAQGVAFHDPETNGWSYAIDASPLFAPRTLRRQTGLPIGRSEALCGRESTPSPSPERPVGKQNRKQPRRWGNGGPQLTLGAALGISLPDMDSPGRHLVTGEVHTISDSVPYDRSWIRGTIAVEECASLVPFLGKGLYGVRLGCVVTLAGYWEDDDEWGTQLRAEICTASRPAPDKLGLIRYLTKNVCALGPAYAERLVDRFKAETLDVLEDDPERAREVFSGRLAERIVAGLHAWANDVEDDRWARHTAARLMMAGEMGYPLARRIVRYFRGSDVADLIARREPYRLLEVPGIGWATADRIARSMGIAPDSEERAEAGVQYALDTIGRQGHTGSPRERLRARCSRLLRGVTPEAIDAAIERCLETAEVVESHGILFRPPALYAEWAIAEFLLDLSLARFPLTDPARATIERVIGAHKLEAEQAQAVRNALDHGVSVLTGRPGTGKTHTQRAIVAACTALGLEVRIAAPTGKAAVRATELTGNKATTIHKLIGGPVGAERKDSPIRGGVLVIDEASMCDTETLAWLAKNVDATSGLRLVLVGDVDQLPSVGAGQILADILRSGVVPTTRLIRLRRTAEESRITTNAHALLDGRAMDLSEASDFVYVPIRERRPDEDRDAYLAAIQKRVVAVVRRLIKVERASLVRKAGLDEPFDPLRDLQVLTPRNSGALGVSELNRLLRPVLNLKAVDGPRISQTHAAVGDRVICTRNDYTVPPEGIMNGEQGVVTRVHDAHESVVVRMDGGRELTLAGVQCYLLSHAFAITTHRAQGSEYPYVVVVYHSSHAPMLDVRLLYTAITRAKRRVILVADRRALEATRQRGSWLERHTGLMHHLTELCGVPT
jgi:exodeoxyribonuclease V alpha subunit